MPSNWDYRAVVAEAQRQAPPGANAFIEIIRMITSEFASQSGIDFTNKDIADLNFFGVGKELVIEFRDVYFEIDLTGDNHFKFIPVHGSLRELYEATLKKLKSMVTTHSNVYRIPVDTEPAPSTNKKLVN